MLLSDDKPLPKELTAVRLRKNSPGLYRLGHHVASTDDLATALALGVQ